MPNRRTSIVTATAVAGSVLAGSAAIAANIGVLRAVEDDSIGNLSAEVTVAGPVDTTIAPAAAVSADEMTSHEFAVAEAGLVTLDQDDTGIRVGAVEATTGWRWTTVQSSPTELLVALTSNESTYELHAAVDGAGVVTARVDQITDHSIAVATPTPPSTVHDGDDDDHDRYDDHDREHEGGDDDD